MTDAFCFLGHTRQAMECPACGEAAHPGKVAKIEHWRWYRSRTSSKRIRAAIDEHLAILIAEVESRGQRMTL